MHPPRSGTCPHQTRPTGRLDGLQIMTAERSARKTATEVTRAAGSLSRVWQSYAVSIRMILAEPGSLGVPQGGGVSVGYGRVGRPTGSPALRHCPAPRQMAHAR